MTADSQRIEALESLLVPPVGYLHPLTVDRDSWQHFGPKLAVVGVADLDAWRFLFVLSPQLLASCSGGSLLLDVPSLDTVGLSPAVTAVPGSMLYSVVFLLGQTQLLTGTMKRADIADSLKAVFDAP